ncbi:MAG: Xanthine dehydrogenase family protein subunit M [Anaerolineales bacterium]|nr:Xanthine dehydrogenase family protein subunit M [Anaerolineales bacterium]MBM2848036.1 Xanthine dehydrogenase family protein subunit [Anaerolineales bacterium]
MIPPAFDYAVPKTLNEAVALLGQNPEAKILAGGHSLIPMMKFRLASPALLVDLNRLDGLAYLREEGGWLKIGAMTREADLDRSDLIHKKYPLLADTAKMIADPVVRNMATVGGNLAHADPANDHPATMLAYGAQVVATGPKGERVIPIDQFFKGPFETALARDEILTEIRIPAPKPRSGGAYMKVERKVGDFATAAVAAQVTLGANGNCESVGIGLTNVGLTPIMAAKAEEALRGKKPDDANIRAAAQLAADAAQPSGDQRGSEEYKRSLVKTLAVRALRKAVERAKGG